MNFYGVPSDERIKNTIQDVNMEKMKELIQKLKPKTFVYNGTSSTQFGLIAQEVLEVFRELGVDPTNIIYMSHAYNPSTQSGPIMSLHYEQFITMLIARVQDLEARVTTLETAVVTPPQ